MRRSPPSVAQTLSASRVSIGSAGMSRIARRVSPGNSRATAPGIKPHTQPATTVPVGA